MTKRIGAEMIGLKVGRLEVISFSHNDSYGRPKWLCKCECGNEKIISQGSLRGKKSLSCGCIQKEFTINRQFKHGMANKPIYQTWLDMKKRCTNPNQKQWADYGGRGIKVCDRWINTFQNFFDDMGDIPFEGAELDRIDNDGNYEPGNVRWVTAAENQQNKRNSNMLTFNGETMCLTKWAEKLGFTKTMLSARINSGRYTVEDALTIPAHNGGCGRRRKSSGSCQVML